MLRFIHRTLIALTLLTGLFPVPLISQTTPKTDFTALESTLVAEMSEKKAVGAAIAIVSGDRLVYARGFGLANAETNSPVTADTLFQTGSVTKPFTAALVLSVAKEKNVDLFSRIDKYVTGLDPAIGKVTLNALLCHGAGLLDEPDEFGPQDESLMAPYIRSWKSDYVLFPDGNVFSYSNSGYALAGFTISEIAGKPYTALMRDRIFAPLGMTRTTFQPTVAMTYPLAVGHQVKDGKPAVVRPLANDARLYPAGTMYTSVRDLSRFAIAFLNDGKIGGQEVISPETIAAMSHGRTFPRAMRGDIAYGYGLFVNDIGSFKIRWHEGGMTGYTASVRFFAGHKVAVIILSNTDNTVFEKTERKAIELMLPSEQGSGWGRGERLLTVEEMQPYVGKYTQPKRFDIEVFIKKGKLYIKEFGIEMPLVYLGDNRFSFQLPRASKPEDIYIQPETRYFSPFLQQYVWSFKKVK